METRQEIETSCPECRTRYRVSTQSAGKRVKCRCGTTFALGMKAVKEPPRSGDDAVADFEQSPQGPATTRQPAASMPRSYSPVAQALLDREDEVRLSSFRERWLPLFILLAGMAVHLSLWLFWLSPVSSKTLVLSIAMATQAVVFVPIMFGSLIAGARWMDVGLGALRPILWKAAALCLGAAAVADVLFVAALIVMDFDWQIVVGGFGFYLVLMGVCAALLFELNVAQTAFIVMLNFVIRVLVAFPVAIQLGEWKWIE